jgi:bacterioferritin-associated ferredoxin
MKAAGVTSLQGAAWLFGAGAACGLCLPYIQRMLETGETEFAVIELE